MTLLLIVMALLTVLAAVWLGRPWWRRDGSAELGRKSANVQAYRLRLAEIDAELAAAVIDAAMAEALRSEAGGRLLEDVADGGADAPRASTSRMRAAALLGLLLAVFAGGYYYFQGSWQAHQLVIGERTAPAAGDVEDMVAALARRMEQNPNDAEGWAMLGQSYFAMQRFAEAAKAYARLNTLTENRDPDALTGEGEALGMAANRELSGRPRELFERALKVQPDHPKSLWYAGMAAYQAGDQATAKAHWSVLRLQILPDELKTILDQRLAEMGEPALAAAPAPTAEAAKPSEARLTISLDLAPALKEQVPANATLIVFARAESGPPMPLAVYRAPLASLPAEITLDDSMAMMPSMKMSAFDRWTVTARISRSGQAQAESGDLQGSGSIAREQSAQGLKLVIDQVVP